MIARAWAKGGRGGADEVESDLAAFGADADTIARWTEPKDQEIPVYPGNEAIVERFFAVATQWRAAPMGGVIGLDYGAVDVCLRRLGLETTPEQWRGLQIMERAAKEAMNRG